MLTERTLQPYTSSFDDKLIAFLPTHRGYLLKLIERTRRVIQHKLLKLLMIFLIDNLRLVDKLPLRPYLALELRNGNKARQLQFGPFETLYFDLFVA